MMAKLTKKKAQNLCNTISSCLTWMANATEPRDMGIGKLERQIELNQDYAKLCKGVEPDNWILAAKDEVRRLKKTPRQRRRTMVRYRE
jgi:hypothetical protein